MTEVILIYYSMKLNKVIFSASSCCDFLGENYLIQKNRKSSGARVCTNYDYNNNIIIIQYNNNDYNNNIIIQYNNNNDYNNNIIKMTI